MCSLNLSAPALLTSRARLEAHGRSAVQCFEIMIPTPEPFTADLHQIIKSGQALTNEHVQYFVYQVLRGPSNELPCIVNFINSREQG